MMNHYESVMRLTTEATNQHRGQVALQGRASWPASTTTFRPGAEYQASIAAGDIGTPPVFTPPGLGSEWDALEAMQFMQGQPDIGADFFAPMAGSEAGAAYEYDSVGNIIPP